MAFFIKTNAVSESPRKELLQELNQTRKALALAQANFNLVSEPQLIEACIYEILSLQAKSDYLLRCLKQLDSDEGAKEGRVWA